MVWRRLVTNIGNALGTSLFLFFLLHGLRQDPITAQDNLLLLIVVYTVFMSFLHEVLEGRGELPLDSREALAELAQRDDLDRL